MVIASHRACVSRIKQTFFTRLTPCSASYSKKKEVTSKRLLAVVSVRIGSRSYLFAPKPFDGIRYKHHVHEPHHFRLADAAWAAFNIRVSSSV